MFQQMKTSSMESTDGPNDGGVDGIYFLIDRDEFIRDDSNTSDRKPSKVSLLIFQVKSGPGSGFQMTEIDKLYHFTNDLLDLTRSAEKPPLSDKYHPDLRTIMQTFKDDYRSFSNPNIDHLSTTSISLRPMNLRLMQRPKSPRTG